MTGLLLAQADFDVGFTPHLAALHEELSFYSRMTADLVLTIQAAQDAAGCQDPTDYRYPTFCKAARVRLSALHRTLDDIAKKIDEAERVVSENTGAPV